MGTPRCCEIGGLPGALEHIREALDLVSEMQASLDMDAHRLDKGAVLESVQRQLSELNCALWCARWELSPTALASGGGDPLDHADPQAMTTSRWQPHTVKGGNDA